LFFISTSPLSIKGILLSIVFVLEIEMYRLNNNKKNSLIVTTATLVMVTTIILVVAAGAVNTAVATTTTRSTSFTEQSTLQREPKAPMAVSQDGNNVYIVWWTNKSENWEVMFRASNDGGQTFGDKINLSNSSDTESQNAEIVAAGENNVYVTWWETSPITGSSESVLRVSTDAGQTFGPILMLGMNGTISTTSNNTTDATAGGEEEGEEGEE
jgi:hypothetical protein